MAEEAVIKMVRCHFCGAEIAQKDMHSIFYTDDCELSTDDETEFTICNNCINGAYECKGYGGCEVCNRWTADMCDVMVRAARHTTGPMDGAEPAEYQDMCSKCAERREDSAYGPD